MISLITGIFMDNHGNPFNPINHGSKLLPPYQETNNKVQVYNKTLNGG